MIKRVVLASMLAFGGVLFFQGICIADICETPGCVTASDIADQAVAKRHVKDSSVITSKIRARNVTSGKIAKGAVGSDELAEDLVLGTSSNDGSLRINRTTGAAALNATASSLILGQSGKAKSDTDLIIRDPNYTTTENALFFNASLSDLRLGSGSKLTPGDDGDLILENGSGAAGIRLDGGSGNATNSSSGNGFVKAWARINAVGEVISCWQCNTDVAETNQIATGSYQVDFTPVSTDISSRPRMAVLDTHSLGIIGGMISLADRAGDPSSVYVRTMNSSGVASNRAFTLIIY